MEHRAASSRDPRFLGQSRIGEEPRPTQEGRGHCTSENRDDTFTPMANSKASPSTRRLSPHLPNPHP